MTTDQHTSPAMARALAAIVDEFDHKPARMLQKLRSDTRARALDNLIVSLSGPQLADGIFGGIQMMVGNTSSQHWRQMRAKALYMAREHQIMVHRPSVRMWLKKAAEHRREELAARYRETRIRNREAA